MALSTIQNNSFADTAVHGFRNLIINGDHQVQQRGTSFSTSGSDRFASDRWALNPIGASPCSASIQFDSTLQKNTLKVTKETSTGDIQIVNKIEGFKQFHNKQFTLSYYVRASTSRDLYIGSGFSSTSGFTSIETTTVPATTQWQKFTRTFSSTDMSSYTENSSSWLRIEFRLSGSTSGSVAAGEWIEFTDVQIELGSEATPFEHRPYADELARCLRYYYDATTYNGAPFIYPKKYVTNYRFADIFYPVPMRAIPTVTITKSNSGSYAHYHPNQYHWKGYISVSDSSLDSHRIETFTADAEL